MVTLVTRHAAVSHHAFKPSNGSIFRTRVQVERERERERLRPRHDQKERGIWDGKVPMGVLPQLPLLLLCLAGKEMPLFGERRWESADHWQMSLTHVEFNQESDASTSNSRCEWAKRCRSSQTLVVQLAIRFVNVMIQRACHGLNSSLSGGQ